MNYAFRVKQTAGGAPGGVSGVGGGAAPAPGLYGRQASAVTLRPAQGRPLPGSSNQICAST